MSNLHHLVTRETGSAEAVQLILSDRSRYPCFAAMLHQIAQSKGDSSPELAQDSWGELNRIIGGKADPASVRRFIARHGSGTSYEAVALRTAMLFLMNEDEARRDQFLALDATDRHHFVRCRLRHAENMDVDRAIAL